MFISQCLSCSTYINFSLNHSQSMNCRYTKHWVAFQLLSVSVYYCAMKSIIVAQSDGQAFLQLSDKGSCEVMVEARTIRAISPAQNDHNNKPCQIMVSTVGLCSFIYGQNVHGLMVMCRFQLTQ